MTTIHTPLIGAVLKSDPSIETFKGEEYKIIRYYWSNPVTKEAFDTTETADASLNQIYNAYRINHEILFPDEIIRIRQALDLTPAKMSALLGLEESKYRFYENGAIPMDEECEQKLQALNSKVAFKECVENGRRFLTAAEYDKAIEWCDRQDEDNVYSHLLQKRDKANGYAALDDRKLKNTVLFFLTMHGATDPSYLNRLLFYTDFVAYRRRGMAFTGLSYRATPHGPAPTNWNYLCAVDGVLGLETEEGMNLYTETEVDKSCFTKPELKHLNMIFRTFANKSTAELSKLSREEEAWKESDKSGKKPISFDYAFVLKAI